MKKLENFIYSIVANIIVVLLLISYWIKRFGICFSLFWKKFLYYNYKYVFVIAKSFVVFSICFLVLYLVLYLTGAVDVQTIWQD